MRKFGTIFLLLCLLLSLAACGSTDQTTGTADPAPAAQPAPTGDGAGSTLVAYFSWAENAVLSEEVDAVTSPSVVPPGNVQQLAAWVQEATGGARITRTGRAMSRPAQTEAQAAAAKIAPSGYPPPCPPECGPGTPAPSARILPSAPGG